MYQPSHRLKIEEKRLYKRLLYTLGLFVFIIIFAVFVGLPVLARIILFFSSVRKEQADNVIKNEIFLLPPTLDHTFEATNSAKITLSGYAEKDMVVKIRVNNRDVANTKTDSDGRFTAPNIFLTEGDNLITAKIVKDKQESSPSSTLNVTYKKSLPKISITAPKNGEKIVGGDKNISITGETDPGNRVTINDHLAIVNQEGKFTFPTSLADGENKFKIKAYDNAGNDAEAEIKVTYTP